MTEKWWRNKKELLYVKFLLWEFRADVLSKISPGTFMKAMKWGYKKVLKQLHGLWFINSNCHVWIPSDGWPGPSFLTSVFSLSSGDQLPGIPLSEVFPTVDLGNILNRFSHIWMFLFLVGFAPFLVFFLCVAFLWREQNHH